MRCAGNDWRAPCLSVNGLVDRWFRAWTTDGPWELVQADQLPSDIAAQVTAKASQNMKLSSASRLAVDQSVR